MCKNMEKIEQNKEKIGIIFGKFYPIHKGHEFFINKVSEDVEKLYVVVCSDKKRDLKLFEESKMEKMPTIENRIYFVKEVFKNNNKINVLHLEEDGIPTYPNGWFNWTEAVKKLLSENNIKIDVVFTNEPQDVNNYKKYFKNSINENKKTFSEKLKIKTIDIERNNYNISATKVRNNPYENMDFLPEIVKKFFES